MKLLAELKKIEHKLQKIAEAHPSSEQLDALLSFSEKHGRRWKSKLLDLWRTGKDTQESEGHLLRQVRNQFGPEWLLKFSQGKQASKVKVVQNKLLGGWFVVTGPHQTPISGRFDSKEEALESLRKNEALRNKNEALRNKKETPKGPSRG